MKKKILITILSVLGVLLIGAVSLIVVLTIKAEPETDKNDVYTGALESETNSTESTESTESTKPTKPIQITNVYEFYDEFKAPEYKQGIYRDEISKYSLPYCVIEPKDYSPDKKYPVLLYLHGAGETGRDNVSQVLTMQDAFKVNGDLLKDVIIICPQTTGWWSVNRGYKDSKGWLSAAVRLVDYLSASYSVDNDRVYVIGISMGGYGTWEALSYFPDKFAAGIPICGGGDSSFGETLADIPIWVYHGSADSTVPVENSDTMVDAIKAAGGNKIHYTRLEGVEHNCWTAALNDREMFNWLLSQNKTQNPSGDYTIAPTFKIIDENGNTVITDADAENPYFYYYKKVNVSAQFKLTDEGLDKLKKAYARGGEFTLIHGNQKLFSFRPTGVIPEHLFDADATYDGEN